MGWTVIEKERTMGTESDSQDVAQFKNVPHIFEAPENAHFLPISSTKRGPLHFIESVPKAPPQTGALGARAPKVRPLSAQKAPDLSAAERTRRPYFTLPNIQYSVETIFAFLELGGPLRTPALSQYGQDLRP